MLERPIVDCLRPGLEAPIRLLDLGCGQGLVFAALAAASRLAHSVIDDPVGTANQAIAKAIGDAAAPDCFYREDCGCEVSRLR